MRYLLDTHAFLWAAFTPNKLSARSKKAILDGENAVCVSSITFWEISLKYGLGKITLENCMPEDLPGMAEQMNIEIVYPSSQESATFYQLPRMVHKDPFDRMIIWQAIQQQAVLISRDAVFPEYRQFGLQVLW